MDKINPLNQIVATALRKIDHPKGDIYRALRIDDIGFAGFGEAYFTTIHHGETKGWKKHIRMTMNLIVPTGMVKFLVYDEENKKLVTHTIGDENYIRLTIPPGYWVSFYGVGTGLNLVLNVASDLHDPNESTNLPLDSFSFANT